MSARSHQDRTGTPERLLRATVDVIAERGWGGVSTRIVAERAGLNPGLVHYHFGSVDELRRRAVLHALSGLFDAAMTTSRDRTPRQIVEASARAATELGASTTLLLFEAMPATARDPRMQEDLADLLRRFRAALSARIRACHREPLADPDVLAGVIAAALDGLLLHLIADPNLDVPAHVAPLLALLGPEAEPTPAATTDEPATTHEGSTR